MGLPDLKKRVINLLAGNFATNGYYGLSDLATTPGLIDDIFGNSYSASERTGIQSWFGARNIEVLGEYNRSPSGLPCVFVYRISDEEAPRSNLGDMMGYENVTSTDLDHKLGARFQETVELTIWAHTDPTMRDALYGTCKMLVLRGRGFLESKDEGVDMVQWKGGRDGQGYLGDKQPHIIHTAQARIIGATRNTWSLNVERPDTLGGSSQYNQWTEEG